MAAVADVRQDAGGSEMLVELPPQIIMTVV
jgi:hypothetical protein